MPRKRRLQSKETTLNTYRTEFFAQCPNNGQRIKYSLSIQTTDVIPVEQIIAKVQSISEGYHEELADDLLLSFSGTQTMVADHHGVMIETLRESREPSNTHSPTAQSD